MLHGHLNMKLGHCKDHNQWVLCSAKIFKSLNPSLTLQLTTWRCRPSRCATRGGTPGTRSRTRSSRRRRAAARTASWWRPAGRGRSGQRRSGYSGAPGGEFLNCDIDIHYKRRWYILSIFVPLSQSNDIAKNSAFKPKRDHESTTGIHLIDEWS